MSHRLRALYAAARRPRRAAGAALLACAALLGACDGSNLFSSTPVPAGGRPVVVSVQAPAEVSEGGVLNVTVRAIAPRGLAQVLIGVTGAITDQRTFDFTPTRSDTVTVNASFTIPSVVTGTQLQVEAVAIDASGAISTAVSRSVDVVEPVITAEGAAQRAN